MLVVVSDKPKLSPGDVIFVVCCDEPEDVLMSEHHCLINLRFPEPAFLISAREYFDCDTFSSPRPSPHLSIPPLAHTLN